MKSTSSLSLRNNIFQKAKDNYLTILLSLALTTTISCENKKTTETAGKLVNLLEMKIQNSDDEELRYYKDYITNYDKANQELQNIIGEHTEFKDIVGDNPISLENILPLHIKESRLNNSVKNKAETASGYGQLKEGAIDDVDKRFKKYNITKKYNPKNSGSDNILYSRIYFSHLVNQINDYINTNNYTEPTTESAFLFACAAYNLGYSKWKSLYNDAGHPDNRDDFAKYITDNLMGVGSKIIVITDQDYNVQYTDRLNGKSYSGDKSIIFEDKKYDIILTKEKAAEFIRYVEIIIGIKRHIGEKEELYKTISIDGTLYSSIQKNIKELELDGKIKEGSSGNLLIEKILLDNGLSMSSTSTPNDKIEVSEGIVGSYKIDKRFGKYDYKVNSYDKEKNLYLRSIVNTLLEDEKFIKGLNEFKDEFKEDGIDEIKNSIRQYVMEGIVRFNQERRLNRKENASQDVRIPEESYFDDYEELRKIETISHEEEKEADSSAIITGNDYISSKDDILGNKPKKGITSFDIHKRVYNSTLQSAESKNGLGRPSMIIIHGTEGNVDNMISQVCAHFFIDTHGNIIQYTTKEGENDENGKMIYPDQIVRLNHAGVGISGEKGFMRKGSTEATYEAIGIEVASTETSRPTKAQEIALNRLITGLSTYYKISQNNIITHQQVAAGNKYGRGRKSDLFGLRRENIGMINNYNQLDKDVIAGKTSPNMKAQVEVLKNRGMSKQEIKYVLNGLNSSIKIHRKLKEKKEIKSYNEYDKNARATLEELEKKGYL